jgi:hypothetical protein
MFPVSVTVPLLQPLPVQPANVDPLAATAAKTICVPLLALWLQSAPQSIPVAVTVPLPLPALLTTSVKELRLKVAAHVMFPVSVTVPLLQPLPVQPANVDPLAAVAVSVTELPGV